MRLSEALEEHTLELFLTPANQWLARSVDGPCEVIDQWAGPLAAWWRQSPTSIRECTECGEISLAGASAKRACHRGYKTGTAKSKNRQKAGCRGTMVPLTPRFTKPRPRGRRTTAKEDQVNKRLIELIAAGERFTADDLTDDGKVTVAGDHKPNASQNAIGTMFRHYAELRYIEMVGTTKARAPHRKGGLIRIWQPTPAGIEWARSAVT